jgi:hypothetical protein
MKKIFFLALAAMVCASCNKDRNTNPITNAQEFAKDRDLQGKTFVASCSATPITGLTTGLATGLQSSLKSEQVTYRFEGANVTHTTRWFESTDCSGDAGLTFEELGDIKIDKNQKTNDNGYNIDMSFNKVKVKISTQQGASAANGISMCGIKDWNAGQERDVTAQSKDISCYNNKVPRQVLNIYRVDANNLMLGTDAKGDVTKRPTSLNMTDKFASAK